MTLIAHSMGAKVVMACIEELVNQLVDRTSPIHPQSVRGLIQDVLIMGTPLSPDAELFSSARSVVANQIG